MFSKNSSSFQALSLAALKTSCAVAALMVQSAPVSAQTPFTDACSKVGSIRIAAFRTDIGSNTTGAIRKAIDANTSGQALRDSFGPDASEGGAWNYVVGLQEAAAVLEPSNQHLCGEPDAANMMACFRVYVVPLLEYELYATSLHAWYNKPQYNSRLQAVASFNAIRDLLKEARSISNDATTCLFESSNDHLQGPGTLVDPK
jgi:hypothetical protein